MFSSKTENDQSTVGFLSIISLTTVLGQKRWKMRLWCTSSSAATASRCLRHVYQPQAFALLPLFQLAAQFTRGNSSTFILLDEFAKSNSAAQETMGAHRETLLHGLWWTWKFLSSGPEVVIIQDTSETPRNYLVHMWWTRFWTRAWCMKNETCWFR